VAQAVSPTLPEADFTRRIGHLAYDHIRNSASCRSAAIPGIYSYALPTAPLSSDRDYAERRSQPHSGTLYGSPRVGPWRNVPGQTGVRAYTNEHGALVSAAAPVIDRQRRVLMPYAWTSSRRLRAVSTDPIKDDRRRNWPSCGSWQDCSASVGESARSPREGRITGWKDEPYFNRRLIRLEATAEAPDWPSGWEHWRWRSWSSSCFRPGTDAPARGQGRGRWPTGGGFRSCPEGRISQAHPSGAGETGHPGFIPEAIPLVRGRNVFETSPDFSGRPLRFFHESRYPITEPLRGGRISYFESIRRESWAGMMHFFEHGEKFFVRAIRGFQGRLPHSRRPSAPRCGSATETGRLRVPWGGVARLAAIRGRV